jgi:hypothetical protein
MKNSSVFDRQERWLCETVKLLFLPFLVHLQLVSNAHAQTARAVIPVDPQIKNSIDAQPRHYSRQQLRLLMADATTADDYQRLATYFHHEELTFRTKAQRTLDDYASYAGKYPMAAKFVTRAEVAARVYNRCVSKANESARLSGQYEERLTAMGIEPEKESATIVSVEALQKAKTHISASAFLETSERSPKPKDR